jgi:hypothetical protein
VVSKRLQRVTQWMSTVTSVLVRQRDRLFDLPEDLEVPGGEIGLRHVAGVKHGPLVRQVLPGRETVRVEAPVDELLLGLRSEERHARLD